MAFMTVILLSTLTIVLTSIVPLGVFFLLGPLLFNHPRRRTCLLPILVSLAAGSLLGDVFFHLIPEIFHLPPSVLSRCTLMFWGVFIFLVGERLLQHYHQGHGHGHLSTTGSESQAHFSALSTSEKSIPLDTTGRGDEIELDLVPDRGMRGETLLHTLAEKPPLPQQLDSHPLPGSSSGPRCPRQTSTKPMGLLILTSDFIHNFVDGIAIGVSYSSSLSVGVSTSVAVFLHEIPHELSDFAILLAAGYQPLTIVICNVLTALSSLLGVFLAVMIIGIQPGAGGTPDGVERFSQTVEPLILSLTAGNFLYIALADLVPELLQGGKSEHGHEHGCELARDLPQDQSYDEENAESVSTPYDGQLGPAWLYALVQYASFLLGALAMYLIKVYSD